MRNGAGTYSLPESPFIFDTVISETAVNSNFSDIANALTASIANDGQTPIVANLPMSNYKHTGVLSTSGTSSRTEYMSTATAQDGVTLDAGLTAGSSTVYTATLTPAIAAYADKQCFRVQFDEACGANPTINFNGVGAKKIYKNVSGSATQLIANDVYANQVVELRYDTALDAAAGGFWLLNTVAFSGGTLTSALNMSVASINEAKGADVASAATTTIWVTDGNFIHITGTTTITSFGTAPQAGAERTIVFDGALTLTHNATSLILPGGANITTAAGDRAIVRAETTANARVVDYIKASGQPVKGGLSTGTVLNLNPYAANTTTTQAHGLGSSPQLLNVQIVCLTAEAGYSIGDVIKLGPASISTIDTCPFTILVDATNVTLITRDSGFVAVNNKSTRANVNLTAGNWRMEITPYAIG